MTRRFRLNHSASWLVCFLWLATPALGLERLLGQVSVHDPSRIVKCGGEYWLFATGKGISSLRSKDLAKWEAGPRVFTNAPAWCTNLVPGFRGYMWAPDVIQVADKSLLFYSVSTWGSQTSAIGLATNPTLDPDDPRYGWTDCGPVVSSSPQEDFNAIDPAALLDSSGRLWLAFGSYWSGIKLVELDRATGKKLDPRAAPTSLAWKEAIEAPAILEHNGFFYLFVNWGQCCRGTNSTYNIRMGRSRAIVGPFLDKSGETMLKGGGSLLLGTSGRFIGPGHAGFFEHGTNTFLSLHYYDPGRAGTAALDIRALTWDAEGWPAAGESNPIPD